MLKLTNLTKKYGDFTLDCTLEVKPGTVTGFIGANGAGKTTTFKALLGLVAADGGEIEIFGNRVIINVDLTLLKCFLILNRIGYYRFG